MVKILLLYCACVFTLILKILAEEGIGDTNNNEGDDKDKDDNNDDKDKDKDNNDNKMGRIPAVGAVLVLRAALPMQDAHHQGLL